MQNELLKTLNGFLKQAPDFATNTWHASVKMYQGNATYWAIIWGIILLVVIITGTAVLIWGSNQEAKMTALRDTPEWEINEFTNNMAYVFLFALVFMLVVGVIFAIQLNHAINPQWNLIKMIINK